MTGRLADGVTATDLVLDRHRDAPQGQGRRQVRRVLRRGRRVAARDRPRDDREHGARVRRDDGLLPGRRGDLPVSARDRAAPSSRSTPSAPTTRPRGSSASRGRASATTREVLELDLGRVRASVAGPKRPQDRIDLPEHEVALPRALLEAGRRERLRKAPGARSPSGSSRRSGAAVTPGGGSQAASERQRRPGARTPTSGPRPRWSTTARRPTASAVPLGAARAAVEVGHGDVLIAAITSCTNTSNPSVMLAAGHPGKKAVERGLTVSPRVKASLAPGSRVVTEYLAQDGPPAVPRPARLPPRRLRLHDLHRQLGPARRRDRRGRRRRTTSSRRACSPATATSRRASTSSIRANFLMSPPLVVAFALAGRASTSTSRPSRSAGTRRAARSILRDVWPSADEVQSALLASVDAGHVPAALRGPRGRRTRSGTRSRRPAGPATPGTSARPTSRSRPSSRASASTPAAHRRRPARARPGDLRRLRDDRPHQPGRARSSRPRPPASTCRRSASSRRTSTATARAAATTA